MRPAPRRRSILAALTAAALLAITPIAGAALAGDQWIHIRVVENGADGETVRINLPLQLVEKILPLVDDEHLRNGRLRTGRGAHLRVNDRDLSGSELREIWQAIRKSPDGEFVTVEGKSESLRVARLTGNMVVRSSETGREKVEIRIPIPVLDALFSSGDSDELDLVAAVRALATAGGTELVAVDDDDSRVRIWVDDRHDSD